jgi:hypothetical protein
MRILAAALVAIFILSGQACVVLDDRGRGPAVKGGGPPPWAPAHGRRAQQMQTYYFYPEAGVYFNPSTRMYFYMNGGSWQVGASLPTGVVLDVTYVSMDLDTDRPYVYFDDHKGKHKVKGKKGKGHGRPF